MDEKPQIKTVRVRINVDENAPPRANAGELLKDLTAFAKKMASFSAKPESEKEE